MRMWVLRFLIAFLVSCVQIVDAQQEKKIIYIVPLADQKQPAEFELLLEDVNSRLSPYNIELQVAPDDGSTSDQQHILASASNTEIIIAPLAPRDFHFPISPILYPNYISPHCCTSTIGVLFNTFDFSPTTRSGIADYVAAIAFYQAGEFSSAVEYFNIALDTATPSGIGPLPEGIQRQIYFYLGNCEIELGNFQNAIEYYEKVNFDSQLPIDGDALPPTSVINLAWLYWQTNRSNDALNLLNTSTIPYRDWDFLSRRAQLYALAERYDDAINDLNAAIELTPDNPELYTLRGQTYLYLYQWDNVLADYNKAVELDPTYADAYFLRGVLYYSILQTGAEHYPDAFADFQRYLQLAPTGEHAADAQKYANQIQAQQDALNP